MDENRLPELPQEAFRPMIAQSVQLEQFLGEELIFCFRDLDGVHTFLPTIQGESDISAIITSTYSLVGVSSDISLLQTFALSLSGYNITFDIFSSHKL